MLALSTALVTLALGGDPLVLWQASELASARAQRGGSADAVAAAVASARRALDEGQLETARVQAARAALVAPDSDEGWRLLGLALFRADRSREAELAFARAVERRPSSASAWFDLGSARFEIHQFAGAETAWVRAASLDARVRPLALLEAGRAALAADNPAAAEEHLRAARAVPAGAAAVIERADELLGQITARRVASHAAASHARVHAATQALEAGRLDEAADEYRSALAEADAAGASDGDRAELSYGLGVALYRAGHAAAAAQALALAVRLAPREADFLLLHGIALADAGEDAAAERALADAIRGGLDHTDVERARSALVRAREHRRTEERVQVDARVAGGWDSNVPQSSVVVTTPSQPAVANPAAAELAVDLALALRPVGSPRNGLAIEYRFGQMAYLSRALDPYSLEEHDLGVTGSWTPRRWLTGELSAQAYLLLAGVETFGWFQVGGMLAAQALFREPRGFETRVRYEHTFKRSLDGSYNYLGGGRDDASLAEWWRGGRARAALSYRLTHDAVGSQTALVAQLALPASAPALPAGTIYQIPYSNLAHEISLHGRLDMGWLLLGALTLRYTHFNYDQPSDIVAPASSSPIYQRTRVDDRFTLDTTVRRSIWGPLGVEIAYALWVNGSTIANRRSDRPLDYDDKNYLKHVVELRVDCLY